jgi:hypothetical protein
MVSGQLHNLATLLLGKESLYPPYMKLGGPQSWSGSGEEKKSQPCQQLNPDHPPHNLVTILTQLPQLHQ